MTHDHTLAMRDGTPIALRQFAPPCPPCASVVIGAAMAVPQDYYAPFAQWLSTQGWHVSTFDYRGTFASLRLSKHTSMRSAKTDLLTWAQDYETVVAHARATVPSKPLLLVGHSLGAQLPGLFAQASLVDALLGVAAGTGYWRDTAPGVRRVSPLFWHLIVPTLTAVCGYFPGKKLGMVGDIPAGAMRQWRRWCLHPHYSAGVEGEWARQRYAQVTYPIRALSIADDEMLTEQSVRNLLALYANAPRTLLRLQAQELGLRRIGHMGPFRAEMLPTLWPQLLQDLNALLAGKPPKPSM